MSTVQPTTHRNTGGKAPNEAGQCSPVMKLYHGTSERHLCAILSEGITPRRKRKGNWQEVPSRPNAVYLTTAYPFYFGIHATLDSTERVLVFEIDFSELDRALLEPDEDFVAESIVHHRKISMAEANDEVRRTFRRYRRYWPESLAGMGCCAHRGTVPVEAITRYCLLEPHTRPELVMTALDPTISVFNYSILGDKYEGLVQWMFGDRDDLPCGRRFPHPSAEELAKYPEEIREWFSKALEYRMRESLDRSGIEVVTLHEGRVATSTKGKLPDGGEPFLVVLAPDEATPPKADETKVA